MSFENILTNDDLHTLVQVAGELTSRIDLSDLLQSILSKSGELTNSPDGAVLLYNPEKNSLYFAGAIGEKSTFLLERYGEFAEEEVPIANSKAGIVFSTRKSIIVDYIPDEVDHYKEVDKKTNQQTLSMLCVPLIAVDKCLGVMQLLNKQSGNYNERDKILLEQFAIYAAIALRNARLFEQLIAHMGLYTSRKSSGGVAELLNQLNSPAHIEKMTVLFADMRGFRLLCQVLNTPTKIIKISSQFVTMLSEQVLLEGGLVNKFLGDGILAIFRDEDHAQRCVRCAFAMIEEFTRLKILWDQENSAELEFLDIGIGITTDDMIIGTIGDEKIHDFTVIGTAVNLASAFEKEARNGKRILADHLTYLAVKDIIDEIEGPVNYELRQPDQRTGNIYKQYHLKHYSKEFFIKKENTVFISHNQSDRAFVEKELLPFFEKNKIKCWYSPKDLKPGESWISSISDKVNSCNWFFVIVSRSAGKSPWVKEEVSIAASRPQLLDKIIPIQLDDTKLEDVHSFLQHKQAIDARNKDKFMTDLLELFN